MLSPACMAPHVLCPTSAHSCQNFPLQKSKYDHCTPFQQQAQHQGQSTRSSDGTWRFFALADMAATAPSASSSWALNMTVLWPSLCEPFGCKTCCAATSCLLAASRWLRIASMTFCALCAYFSAFSVRSLSSSALQSTARLQEKGLSSSTCPISFGWDHMLGMSNSMNRPALSIISLAAARGLPFFSFHCPCLRRCHPIGCTAKRLLHHLCPRRSINVQECIGHRNNLQRQS